MEVEIPTQHDRTDVDTAPYQAYIYHDGGRSTAGKVASTKSRNDCVIRALSIAMGMSYELLYGTFRELKRSYWRKRGEYGNSHGWNRSCSPSHSIPNDIVNDFLSDYGWGRCLSLFDLPKYAKVEDIPCTGETVVVICKVKGSRRNTTHLVAINDNFVFDTFDSREAKVLGIWMKDMEDVDEVYPATKKRTPLPSLDELEKNIQRQRAAA